MIVAISGKFCSGKDTVADHLVRSYGFRRVAFADKLKDLCKDLFGMQGKDRALLQRVGSSMRDIDPQVWVKYPFRTIQKGENVVITDMRYRNEAQFVRLAGGRLVRLDCDKRVRHERYLKLYGRLPSVDEIMHPSEIDLDQWIDWDLAIGTDIHPIDEAQDMLANAVRVWGEYDRRQDTKQMELPFHATA